MGQHRYKIWNGPAPTTAAQVPVTTGTAIKTMLQIAPPATRQITVISWGFSLGITPAAGPNTVELIDTDVAATVTAHVAAGVQPLIPGVPASQLTLGVNATGYTATVEGAITTTRTHDVSDAAPTAGAYDMNFRYQFMPDERPVIAVSRFLRVRATFATAVNMHCWVVVEE